MAERQPYHPPIPEPQRVPHEGGNGSPGLPPTLHERAKPPPESTLSRAVERTRELYERNGWVFLPLGEAGKGSPSEPNSQTEQTPQGGDTNRPKLDRPELKEEIPEVKDRIDAIRQAIRSGAFYSGVGLGDIPIKHKGKESAR